MSTFRRVCALLAALVLCLPAMALGQTRTLAQNGAGVSTQPPVALDGDDAPSSPAPSTTTPPRATSGSELPNTGTDPRLLFAVGVALVALGAGLRLRTADAELY